MTLYEKLKNNLREQGYEVEEGSWIEGVGYKKPTKEYWLDVTLKFENNVKFISHYYFKDNLNKIHSLEFWKYTYELVEKDQVKIC